MQESSSKPRVHRRNGVHGHGGVKAVDTTNRGLGPGPLENPQGSQVVSSIFSCDPINLGNLTTSGGRIRCQRRIGPPLAEKVIK